ncbi:hypothetical protein TRVL_09372 [Trypanosoma vivax]|nr:hypothetical protein TRVL_09372 [Trypanosoma vivax]
MPKRELSQRQWTFVHTSSSSSSFCRRPNTGNTKLQPPIVHLKKTRGTLTVRFAFRCLAVFSQRRGHLFPALLTCTVNREPTQNPHKKFRHFDSLRSAPVSTNLFVASHSTSFIACTTPAVAPGMTTSALISNITKQRSSARIAGTAVSRQCFTRSAHALFVVHFGLTQQCLAHDTKLAISSQRHACQEHLASSQTNCASHCSRSP